MFPRHCSIYLRRFLRFHVAGSNYQPASLWTALDVWNYASASDREIWCRSPLPGITLAVGLELHQMSEKYGDLFLEDILGW